MVHSSFLLALPLAHLGTARYLPWINNRDGPVNHAAAMAADPVHESMSMSMSHSMDDGQQMPAATGVPISKRQVAATRASISKREAAPTGVSISKGQAPVAIPQPSVASVAIASVVPTSAAVVPTSAAVAALTSGFAPKGGATNFSIVSITVPTALAVSALPKAPGVAATSAALVPTSRAFDAAASTSAGARPTANPVPAPLAAPAPVPAPVPAPIPDPAPAPVAPGSPAEPAQPIQAPQPVTPKSPAQPQPGQPIPAPRGPVPPRNPAGPVVVPIAPPAGPAAGPVIPKSGGPPPANMAFDAALANGLDLNVLTLEAQYAASTDLLDMAQKGNPLDATVYSVAKENLKTLQVAGVRIRMNNMQLAKNNPKVLRTLASLQAEQAKEMEMSSKLTGDATGDLSVLIQLQKMLATGIQRQSQFIEQSIPQQPGQAPRAGSGAAFPVPAGAAGAQPFPAAAAAQGAGIGGGVAVGGAQPVAVPRVPAAAGSAGATGAPVAPKPASPPEEEDDE